MKMQIYLIKDLLSKGALPDAVDPKGNGPFHYLFSIFEKDANECAKIGNLLLAASINSIKRLQPQYL